jgi:HSP20 family protein
LSDPWWRRRKKKDPWFNEIHDELEKLGDLIDETMHKVFENSSDKTPVRRNRVKGFSIKTNSNGKTKIREFDSRQPFHEEDELVDDPEPLIDLIEDSETLFVLVALSGVKKDDIKIRATESCLTISIDTAEFEWCDELDLPAKVKPKSASASYRNGVLEVKLEKLEKIVRDDRISVKK